MKEFAIVAGHVSMDFLDVFSTVCSHVSMTFYLRRFFSVCGHDV